jgi:hypothetical protein
MDTTTTPWSMTDVTAQITQEGTEALQAQRSAQRQKLDAAALALAVQLRQRPASPPMLKKEAEAFLRDHGRLTARQAKNLLENGYNSDIHHEGLWVLREIAGQRGHPVGVYLTAQAPRACAGGGKEDVRNNANSGTPHETSSEENTISYTPDTSGVRNTVPVLDKNHADLKDTDFVHPLDRECTKSTPLTPAETLGETEGVLFRTRSHTPDDLCLHEHIDETGRCNDCGQRLQE